MNPYEVLELQPGASSDEIKSAYHRLAKQWHPDRFSGREKDLAEIRFRELADAFNQLKDPARRLDLAKKPEGSAPVAAAGPTGMADRTAEEWYQEAKEAFAEQQLERTLGLVQVAIRQDAKKAKYHQLYAEVLIQSGADGRTAVKALEIALRLEPQNADACILLAGLYEKQGLPMRAQKLLQTAREIAPNHKYFRQAARKTAGGKPAATDLGGQVKALYERFFRRG